MKDEKRQMEWIAEGLRGLAVPVEQLHEDPANARTGHAVDRIAASLAQYGQRTPLVANRAQNGKVEKGNGTLRAAKQLGWSHVAVLWVEDDPATAAGYGIADNRTGELSGWDVDVLGTLIESLPGDIFTGFEAGELEELLGEAVGGTPAGQGDAPAQVDRAAELAEEWGVEVGQVWELASKRAAGAHRLACGDCRDRRLVERLLDGARPGLMITDPPYGVEYDPSWRQESIDPEAEYRLGAVTGDERSDWRQAWALFPGDVAYVWHGSLHAVSVARSLEAVGFELRSQIVWVKPRIVISRGHYHWQHEVAWYAVRAGATAGWIGDRRQSTVWEMAGDESVEGGHSTQKPVEAMARPLANHRGDVYEPFGGSGTTFVAAENAGRRCFGLELEPGYVAVTLQRYLDAFGIRGEVCQ